jgi:hypothetical protein
MTTTGTALFSPDVSEIIEESYERCGLEASTGYEVRTARRSLNLLALEWGNRGINLWTIDSNTVPLLAATATYTLPADTIDLLDVVIRTTNAGVTSDIGIGRLSVGEYANIPTKQSPGRPVQFYVDRQAAAPTVTVWPVPPDTAYTLVYWRMRRIQDAGTEGSTTLDAPARAIPALISGLAYYLAMKRAPERMDSLKMIYEEQFDMMQSEDRERASYRITPRIGR